MVELQVHWAYAPGEQQEGEDGYGAVWSAR